MFFEISYASRFCLVLFFCKYHLWCDANGLHFRWGNTNINERSQSIMNFMKSVHNESVMKSVHYEFPPLRVSGTILAFLGLTLTLASSSSRIIELGVVKGFFYVQKGSQCCFFAFQALFNYGMQRSFRGRAWMIYKLIVMQNQILL